MKTRYNIIIIGIVLATTIFGTYQSLMYQCGTLPIYMETPKNPNLWHCLEIWEKQHYPPPCAGCQDNEKDATLHTEYKPHLGLGLLNQNERKTTVSDHTTAQLEAVLKYCIDSKELVETVGLSYYNETHFIDTITCEWQKHDGIQIDSEGLDSGWITGEDYCQEWCDNDELYQIGCDRPILAHITKYSNLLDEEFDGTYSLDWIGLPDGVSIEKFEWCVDFIYKKRTSVELENPLCMGGRGMIVNEDCEIIGKYDVSTGMTIVENKEQCDMLEGDWDEKQNYCDSKYGGSIENEN